MQSPPSVHLSVRLFPFYLRNRLTVDIEVLHARRSQTVYSSQRLKVKVKVMGQDNAVGPTSTEGSFSLVLL